MKSINFSVVTIISEFPSFPVPWRTYRRLVTLKIFYTVYQMAYFWCKRSKPFPWHRSPTQVFPILNHICFISVFLWIQSQTILIKIINLLFVTKYIDKCRFHLNNHNLWIVSSVSSLSMDSNQIKTRHALKLKSGL